MEKKTTTKKPLKKGVNPISKKIKKEAGASPKKVSKKTVKKVRAKKARQKSIKAKPNAVSERPKKAAKKILLDLKVSAQEQILRRTEKPREPQKREREIGLPEEYGENDLLLMVVDPITVFASWEITKDFLPHRGDLTARILDVTGVRSGASPSDRFFEIGIDRWVGTGFFDIRMPGREVIMEIGLFEKDGAFRAIVRSDKVSIPALLTFDELGIVKKLFEEEIPVGY